MKRILLGYTKKEYYGEKRPVYLTDFKWDCNWYWSGGYIGNKNFHAHFDGAFLNTIDDRGHSLGNFVSPYSKHNKDAKEIDNGCSIWEPVTTFLEDVPEHIEKNWWRIKDLFKQFYTLKEAAETFQYGGHCSADGRNPRELNKKMAYAINKHIEQVIIYELRQVLRFIPVDEFVTTKSGERIYLKDVQKFADACGKTLFHTGRLK